MWSMEGSAPGRKQGEGWGVELEEQTGDPAQSRDHSRPGVAPGPGPKGLFFLEPCQAHGVPAHCTGQPPSLQLRSGVPGTRLLWTGPGCVGLGPPPTLLPLTHFLPGWTPPCFLPSSHISRNPRVGVQIGRLADGQRRGAGRASVGAASNPASSGVLSCPSQGNSPKPQATLTSV